MNPVILSDSVLGTGTLAATNTAPGYDVLNIRDWRVYTLWKASAAGTLYLTFDLDRMVDGGLEAGTSGFSDMGDATRSSSQAHSGSYSAELVGSGSPVIGPYTAYHEIEDLAWTYVLSVWVKVTTYTSGTVTLGVFFYDEDQNLIGTGTTYGTITQVQDWTQYIKTVGPGGDVAYPAGAKYFRVAARISMTATAYYDDFLVYRQVTPDSLYVLGHNLWSADADVSLEYSDDATAAITTWTEKVAAFTPGDNKGFIKTFNGQASRAWRLKMVTANIAPSVAVVLLGPRITLPYPPDGPYDHYNEGAKRSTKRGMKGDILGTVTEYEDVKLGCRVSTLSRSWVTGTFKPFWDSHGIKGLPFAFAWDLGTFPDDVFYVHFPDGHRFRMPLRVYPMVESLELEMEGVKE